jgi:hypothetical protein
VSRSIESTRDLGQTLGLAFVSLGKAQQEIMALAGGGRIPTRAQLAVVVNLAEDALANLNTVKDSLK